MNKWDLAAEAARRAGERDAATTKGKLKRAAEEKRGAGRAAWAVPSGELDKGKLLSEYEDMVRGKLKFLSYAPIVFLSRSEEHTSELQSHLNLVCRLLLEKKKTRMITQRTRRHPSPHRPTAR